MFLALPVDAHGIDGVRAELERSGRCLKVVHEKNYHITLKFLGDTDTGRYDVLVAALDSSSRPQRVECFIKGLGCFPNAANPSVIWAGMEYASGLMDKLFLFAENAAVGAGFPPEQRKFSPHLTLARVRRESTVPAALRDYIKGSSETVYSQCVIDRVVLFESVPGKGGPEYIVHKEWELS